MDNLNKLYAIYGHTSFQKTPDKNIIEIKNTNRETLAHILAIFNLNVGAEIGVECGIYSEILCKANPNIDLYAIDAWTAYQGYRDHVSQEKLDGFMKITQDRLAPYKATVIKGFSVDVAKQFKDNSLDFVYIDGNHEYRQTVDDISEWDRKVKVGGIVAGHDYILRRTNGYLMHVPHALHGWMKSYDIKPVFILGGKQDRKPPHGCRDVARSWFYFKQAPAPIVPGSGHKIKT